MSTNSNQLTQGSLSFSKSLKRKREEDEAPQEGEEAPDKELENLPKPSPKCRKLSQDPNKVLIEKNTNKAEARTLDAFLKKLPSDVALKEKLLQANPPPSSTDQPNVNSITETSEEPSEEAEQKEESLDSVEEKSKESEPDVSMESDLDQSVDVTQEEDKEDKEEEEDEEDISESEADKTCDVSLQSNTETPSIEAKSQDSDQSSLNKTASPSGRRRTSQTTPLTKKKRMSTEEAKAKAEEREKRLKQREEAAQQKKLLLEKKQAEKEEKLKERQKKKEQDQKEKEEKLRQKEEKTKARMEEKKKKEEERKKREEERKKREEDKKKKEEEKKKKDEEKKKKDEEKKKKEEERKKKEEEKKKKEEEKLKKDEEKEKSLLKTKEVFRNFFLKTQGSPKTRTQTDTPFLPFQVQKNMTLAPVVPTVAVDRFKCEPLDHYLEHQDQEANYLKDLCTSSHTPHTQAKPASRPLNPDIPQYRAKLLQFSENVRPPYWGTWRKTSKLISPKNPFKEDKDHFDYEVDSDEEWDEGGPGESLEGTDDEKESGGEEDASDEDDFIVPHGYLSAEEEEEDEPQEVDHERMKEELKLREKGFYKEIEAERRKKSNLKLFIVGCIWQCEGRDDDDGDCLLSSHSAVLIDLESCTAVDYPSVNPINLEGEWVPEETPTDSQSVGNRKKVVSEAAMPHLIRLFHGNNNSRVSLMKEFITFWKQQSPESGGEFISQRQLAFKIQEICVWHKEKPAHWAVKDEVRVKYGLGDLSLSNQWNYITMTPRPVTTASPPKIEENIELDESIEEQTPLTPAASLPSIRKFITITPRTLNLTAADNSSHPPPDTSTPDEISTQNTQAKEPEVMQID